MPNWQLTATTIYCDAVDDEVTVMVYKDWSVKCTGFNRYHEPGSEGYRALKKKSQTVKRMLACEGLGCRRIMQYKEKLLLEEKTGHQAQTR